MLKLYNTLTRKVQLFKPLDAGKVKMYTCGPTVYNYPHIGNYRAYLFSDLLKRYLKYKNFEVKHVMNITDVDDKTIRDSQKEKISLKEFTERYTKAFFEDLEKLNIEPANTFPRATETIKEMVEIIKKLLEKGIAYKGEDGSIYYKVLKFKNYGKLAQIDVKKLKEGASGRVKKDEYTKEQVQDFALWKLWDENDGDVFWNTEIGKGRPGWHIECSAMSIKFLGETFDIHTGGIDLVFPHHQNEIAQSEAFTGKKFVKYWLHNEWLLVEGNKMSKSLGNFYTLRDVLSKGYDPSCIRYALLSTHYRQQFNFTFQGLEASKNSLQRIQDFMKKLEEAQKVEDNKKVLRIVSKAKVLFEKSMNNDLDISPALASIFDMIREVNILLAENNLSKKDASLVKKQMLEFDKVLGILKEDEKLSEELKKLIDYRETARKQKNWTKADQLRDELKQKGIILEDTQHGVRWKKV